MATYKCAKCGNSFDEREINQNRKSKDQVPGTESSLEKCCPTCSELGDLCKDDEESKADRYD